MKTMSTIYPHINNELELSNENNYFDISRTNWNYKTQDSEISIKINGNETSMHGNLMRNKNPIRSERDLKKKFATRINLSKFQNSFKMRPKIKLRKRNNHIKAFLSKNNN
jgi:hypothetical protein